MTYLIRTNRWTLPGYVVAVCLLGSAARAQVPAAQTQQQTPATGQSDPQQQEDKELKQAQQEREEAQKQAQKARDDAQRERDRALKQAARDRDQAQREAQRARDEAQRERDQALREAQREVQRAREDAQRMRDDALRQRDDVMRLVGASVKLVKDKPFTAQAVTESVQVLPDGNRIVRHNETNYFRDSSGRTRREQTLGGLGPQMMGGPMQTIFIYDPVAKVDYVVDPDSKHARRIVISKMESESGGMRMEIHINNLPGSDKSREAKEETLPNKTIEGLDCTGKRTTVTIAAGQIGNEKPIAIVQETWYSPDIEAVVQSTTSDPRSGTTSYKLTNVKRVEPPAGMFEPPSDYSVSGPRSSKSDTKTDSKTDTKKDSKTN
jgi:flagellar biosynthesis GTPase FlhF